MIKETDMDVAALALSNYIMIAELLGLWIILAPTIYLLHPVILLAIMEMAEFITKHRFLYYLPLLISAPLLYTSQWTHLLNRQCYYSDSDTLRDQITSVVSVDINDRRAAIL